MYKLLKSHFLGLFLLIFIGLGLGYDTLTPIFEQSDETLHYPYIKHIADGNGLPLAIPDQLWNQEGTQPPLYYSIVAATTFWVDSDNLLDHLQYNPHWLFTDLRAVSNDNQNRVLHGPMDAFPYQHAALAIHIGRWWSLLFGMLTVLSSFFLLHHLFPHQHALIITSLALITLNPQFLRVSATVSNDSLSAFLTTLTVLLTFKLTSSNQATSPLKTTIYEYSLWSAAGIILLGVLCGLATLTKLSSLSTIILVTVVILWQYVTQNPLPKQRSLSTLVAYYQPPIRALIIIGLTMLTVTGWWFYRNYYLYGEWFATDTHLDLAGRGTLSLLEIWQQRTEILRAYWGTFGWGQIRLPEPVYQFLGWFTTIGMVGVGYLFLREAWRVGASQSKDEVSNLSGTLPPSDLKAVKLAESCPPKEGEASSSSLGEGVRGRANSPLWRGLISSQLPVMIFLLFWSGINLLLYIRWVMEVGSVSHTRLMFPAIMAISVLLGLGWHAWLPKWVSYYFAGGLVGGLLLINLTALTLLNHVFQPTDNLPRPNNPLELVYVDGLQLLTGQVGSTPKPQAKQGEIIRVQAQWQALKPLGHHYSLALVVVSPDGTVLGHRETYPSLGLRPTRYLQPNQPFVDQYPIPIEGDVAEPLLANVTISLFDFDSAGRDGLPVLDQQGNLVTPIVGQVKLVPQSWPQYQPMYDVQVNFADSINLIGYDLVCQTEMTDCQTMSFILYWQSTTPVNVDYMVFVHLFDETGTVLAQFDGPPANNHYPTSWWSIGEIIADPRSLALPATSSVMQIGLYDLQSGQRLPIVNSSLPHQNNSVTIPTSSQE
ncbi:hypothetical protein QUF64_13970 [Anaerolineales bacterium HSG6]|nr:hypothetical protein [Anaerolineales bacterium HSG6]